MGTSHASPNPGLNILLTHTPGRHKVVHLKHQSTYLHCISEESCYTWPQPSLPMVSFQLTIDFNLLLQCSRTHLFPLFYCYCSSLAYSYQSVTPTAKGIVLNNSWITRIELYRASRWTSEAASGTLPSIAIHFLSFHLKKDMLKVVSICPRPQSYLT